MQLLSIFFDTLKNRWINSQGTYSKVFFSSRAECLNENLRVCARTQKICGETPENYSKKKM